MGDGADKDDAALSTLPPGAAPAVDSRALDEPALLRLLAEELSVEKETVETGRVHVATHTVTREALVDEDLARERVEIETVPVGRRIEKFPEVRQEGDVTIFPVVEEVLFVERRLVLKEEIRIRKVRTTERYQEKVTLRHQEAVVTRRPDDTGNADASSAAGQGGIKPEK